MKSLNFITVVEPQRRRDTEKASVGRAKICVRFILLSLRLCASVVICFGVSQAQRIAILTPDNADASRQFAEKLETALAEKHKILDDSLSETAFRSAAPDNPFNLTTGDSKRIGAVIGCDYFLLLRSANLRRSSTQRPEYYESNAVIYAVSSRTGRLVLWKLQHFEAGKPVNAAKMLVDSINVLASDISAALKATLRSEINAPVPPQLEEVPDADSPEAKNFRAPIPYRRIKPEYTAEAGLYDIKATVDILVDTDATGAITRTEIVRWAGYGLDESVERAVRQMNWRPAERNGKTLPMRFLVRYNFKKMTE